jgi:ABC-type molybdate transport system substrate-binding protein
VNARVLILLGFAIGIGAILYFNQRNKAAPAPGETAGKKSGSGVPLTVLYSTEKKEWLEAATQAFAKDHSDIDVQLQGKGSLEAMQGILDGKDKPVLWSPADSLVLGLGAADWTTKTGSLLVAAEGASDAPAPLVITPLVFVVWEDRAEPLLNAAGGKLTWKTLHDAIASNRGWPAVGGKPDWGFVKLGHTDPTRSNSGLSALLSMTLEYWKKPSITVADLLDPKYQAFIAEIEKGVGKFETSTGTFMTDMIRFGPSRFDIAWVYENLAASQLENAQGRWGNLKVYYPQTTVWSDHPIALLMTDWVTDAQKKAARQYIAFLRSRTIQEQALGYGFRPADPAVPVKTQDPRNPFVRLAPYGLRADVPPAAVPPDAAVVRNMLTMWSRTVASR